MFLLSAVNDMSKEHGGPLSSPMDEAEVVSQSRLEARHRYEQFKRLSAAAQPAPSGMLMLNVVSR